MRRSKSANLTTFSALTPGRNCLMCWIRACSSCALKAGFPESSTRLSAKNALRITLRQLPDDLAKIAHSCAVVLGFTCALLLAKSIALCGRGKSAGVTIARRIENGTGHVRLLVVYDVHTGPDLSVGPARAVGCSCIGSETEEVQEPVSLDRLLELALRLPKCSRVL